MKLEKLNYEQYTLLNIDFRVLKTDSCTVSGTEKYRHEVKCIVLLSLTL